MAAYQRAHACDSTSAFGGIVALNRKVTEELATSLTEIFTEVVVAPSFSDGAMDVLKSKKNLRVIEANSPSSALLTMRSIDGGLLVQTTDRLLATVDDWTVATERAPTDAELADLDFAWQVAARVTSNTCLLYTSPSPRD